MVAPTGASVPAILATLALILVAAKLLGAAAERIGQPSVLGELGAGILLGALGLMPAESTAAGSFVHLLAEFGVVMLLFEIGLETDLQEMFRVGSAAASVAVVGVVIPFALGYVYWAHGPHAMVASTVSIAVAAIFVGATLTATSVGITARILSDLKRLHTEEAKVILGAAIIDDVLGLVILSVVSTIAGGTAVTAGAGLRVLLVAVGFLVVAVVLGLKLAPRLFDRIAALQARHVLVVFAVAFALLFAALADAVGSAMIIGAFAAGLILSGTNQFHLIEDRVRPIGAILTPVFFVSVGAQADLGLFDVTRPGAVSMLLLAFALTALALLGKLASGWAAPWARFDPLTVGVGMVPRGEVGLIFADIGRRTGILGEPVFNAVLIMVLATTIVAPIGLKKRFARLGTAAG
ncbi:MAG TPA: cation:proton antiporter [Gemmatimonadales bacterium]|nr:cation:proton antiporter [Gemmatimonadales bacterium]